MSRAEKRQAARKGDTAGADHTSAIDDDNGIAMAVSEVLAAPPDDSVVSLRGKDWPYYGGRDAVQADSVPWDPSLTKMPRRKLAIVGFTPSRALAPFGDPEYEVWACNALYTHKDVPRVTRWFDMHKADVITEERISFYNQINIPIFLQDVREDVRDSVRYPKEEVEAFFKEMAKGGSGYDGDYFTNTISWQIALAIWEGFEVIDVYGVDMGQESEYVSQRPNVEFFLGICLGRGIEFSIPQTSDLLKATHQYGYGSDGGFRAKLIERRDEFAVRKQFFFDEIEKRQVEIRQLRIEAGIVDGAMQNVLWCIRSWCVADHTSMTSDADKLAEENGTEHEGVFGARLQAAEASDAVEVLSIEELQAADAENPG